MSIHKLFLPPQKFWKKTHLFIFIAIGMSYYSLNNIQPVHKVTKNLLNPSWILSWYPLIIIIEGYAPTPWRMSHYLIGNLVVVDLCNTGNPRYGGGILPSYGLK